MDAITPTSCRRLGAVLLAAFAAATSGCTAAQPPAQAWWQAPGFSAVDADLLEGAEYYSAERFPGQGASVFHPDAGLPAPVRALLMVEHREGLLPHARYRVAWHVADDPDAADHALHYVEVQRFNLGPARHADLRASVPEEHLADVTGFGVGADVAWRFVMAPRRGMRAGLVHAARHELSAEASLASDCLGAACAALPDPVAPAGTWFDREVAGPSIAYAPLDDGPHPARVADDLVAALGEEAERALPYRAGAPRFVLVISANADGQDLATTALARDAMVMDDEIGTAWVRWRQGPGQAPESALLYQPRER